MVTIINLNWPEANAWETLVNSDKHKFSEPTWRWDCNFKLDFDGPLMSIRSRFYPPHKNNHNGWEGTVTVYDMRGKELENKAFKTDTLEQLHKEVEYYVYGLSKRITIKISD
jgi:hypothetical protein